MKTQGKKFFPVMVLTLVLIFALGLAACQSYDSDADSVTSTSPVFAPVQPVPADVSAAEVPQIRSLPFQDSLGFPQISSYGEFPTQGISVSGNASMDVAPDIAIINLSVESTRDNVEDAATDVRSSVAEIVSAITGAGGDNTDVNTAGLRINLDQRWRDGELVLEGYRAHQNLQVRIRDLDAISNVVDSAIGAGGNFIRFSGVNFTLENPAPYLETLRGQAAADAVRRAELYADGLGVNLGGPIYLRELSDNFRAPYDSSAIYAQSAGLERSFDSPSLISPDDIVLGIVVEASFAIATQ